MKRVLISIAFFFLLLTLTSCETVNRWRSTTPVELSGPIEVGSEWTEITPPNPLISRSGTNQRIIIFTPLDITGSGGKDKKTLKLKDGTLTKVEAYLYDDNGKSYELFISGYGNTNVSFDNNPPNSREYFHFPNGQYIKLKIRSETPIKVEKIEWRADYQIDNML